MPSDRLDALLSRFHLEARVFHSGLLCGSYDFDAETGYLHFVRRGPVRVHHAAGKPFSIEEPSAILYAAPTHHRFICAPDTGADLVCASVRIGEPGAANPIVASLPPCTVIPLAAMPTLGPALELLFGEAFGQSCGRLAAVNRLFELAVIHVLRFAMVEGRTNTGMLAGLSDPALAKAIVAMHEQPGHEWTLEELAKRAGMSRSRFASTFHETVGLTPGNYLAGWRVTVAQDLLRKGRPLKVVANEVGYASPVALSRVFKAKVGSSPREWLALPTPSVSKPLVVASSPR